MKKRSVAESKQSAFLEFDFPGLRIGTAEYAEGPTGVTVFHFPDRVFGAVDTRGGTPGSSLTEALQTGFGKFVDAILFCGGSTYGLEAASGVAAGLLHSGAASGVWGHIAVVPAAVLFDFKGRRNTIYPDRELGLAALESARDGQFPLGACGAGAFVHCGSVFGERFMERAGQGAAFLHLESTRLAVFTVINARGVIMNREGEVVAGNRDSTGVRTSISTDLRNGRRPDNTIPSRAGLTDSTTLTLVVTNRVLNQSQLQRLAIQTHSSMARAIQPFHTYRDGDTLFAVTTSNCEASYPHVNDLPLYASELAWDAVLNSIPQSLTPDGVRIEK